MRSPTRVALAMAVAVLAMSGCGSASTSSHPSPSPSSASTPLPHNLMVLVVQTYGANPHGYQVKLVDGAGRVATTATFMAPYTPRIGGCATVTPPLVRVAGGAVFAADSAGAVWRLDGLGHRAQVARFHISNTTLWSWAVSPDGQQFISIILTTPPLLNPLPAGPLDPFVPSGHWSLDLYTEAAGGSAVQTLHKDLGHALNLPGPTLIAGWDDAGPVATLNSYLCVQNPLPSAEYAGSPLIHLASDGTHLDLIGGSACRPLDELHDGTVLCLNSDSSGFAVRSRNGAELWARQLADTWEAKLSPDASGVAVSGVDKAAILLRDGTQAASSVRTALQPPDPVLLGWFGNDYVVAVRGGTHLVLIPARHASTFIAVGDIAAQPVCTDCFPPAVSLAGTIAA